MQPYKCIHKNICSITGVTQIPCPVKHGRSESKIKAATTFLMLSFAFITFLLSLLFHPPKWNILGSKCFLNSNKLDQVCSQTWKTWSLKRGIGF